MIFPQQFHREETQVLSLESILADCNYGRWQYYCSLTFMPKLAFLCSLQHKWRKAMDYKVIKMKRNIELK